MRESITILQFLTSFILYSFNSITFLLFLGMKMEIVVEIWDPFYGLILPYFMNSIYLFINLLCDFSLYAYKSKFLEKLNHWNRNTYCHISNTFSYIFIFSILYSDIFHIFAFFFLLNVFFNIIDLIVHEHNRINFNIKILSAFIIATDIYIL